MGASEWTSIILGVLTLLGGCGWFVEGRKHREATRRSEERRVGKEC